jgi:hypothetical protein
MTLSNNDMSVCKGSAKIKKSIKSKAKDFNITGYDKKMAGKIKIEGDVKKNRSE